MVLHKITSKLSDMKYRLKNKYQNTNTEGLGDTSIDTTQKKHFYTKFLDIPKHVYDKTKIKLNSIPIYKKMSSLLPGEKIAKVDDVTIEGETLLHSFPSYRDVPLHRFSDLSAPTSGFFGSFPNLYHKPALTFGFKRKCSNSDSLLSLSVTNDNLYKISKSLAPYMIKRRPSTDVIETEELKEEVKDTTFKDVYCNALHLASSLDLSMHLDTHLFYIFPIRVISNVSRDHNVFVTALHCGPLNARVYCSEKEVGSSAGFIYSLFSGNLTEATYYINRKALEVSNTQTIKFENISLVLGIESVINVPEANKAIKEFIEEEKTMGNQEWSTLKEIAPLNLIGKLQMGKNEIMVGYMPSSKILETGGKLMLNDKDYLTASFIASMENNDNLFNIGLKKRLNEKIKVKMAFDSMYKLHNEFKLKVDSEIYVKINLDWNVLTGGNNVCVRIDYAK